MVLPIGKRIKQFRQEQGITQEQLAEALNISYQAVSKWENALTYPDITLVPDIADFFGVSCDALLTNGDRGEQEDIQVILAEADTSERPLEILERALIRFPNSYELMMALSEAYSKQNICLDKVVLYCQRIYENCNNLKLKYEAVQLLCYIYRSMGRYAEIKELAEQMPEIYQTRPALMSYSLPGEEIYRGMEEYLRLLKETAESIERVLQGASC